MFIPELSNLVLHARTEKQFEEVNIRASIDHGLILQKDIEPPRLSEYDIEPKHIREIRGRVE
jgi:hypothetical protein